MTPATADDLRSTGNMAVSPEDSAKSVQVKVPVVATIIQKVEASGKFTYSVEPPGPEQEEGIYKISSLNSELPLWRWSSKLATLLYEF